jgi:two-component sensor histidine kinase
MRKIIAKRLSSFYVDVPALRPGTVGAYALAVVSVGVATVLAPFADLVGSRIVVRGPKLRLNAASAQAIGLALHELTTNAGKYGALSMDGGRVYVCWEIDSDTLIMSWTERDGPPVSAPQRRGFGSIVMETMTQRSVGGAVDLDYAPPGLTCPAANALEPPARYPPADERP